MLIKREFVFGSTTNDRGFEATGWIPGGLPGFDAGQPIHVMHDTLEHLDFNDSSLEGEMKAIGSMFVLRAAYALRSKDEEDLLDSIGSDMAMFLMNDEHTLTPPAVKPPAMPTEMEKFLENVNSMAFDTYAEHEGHDHVKWKKAEFVKRVAIAGELIREGYEAAEERYGKLTPQQRIDMVRGIRNGAMDTRKGVPMDGDTLTVTADTDTGKFTLTFKDAGRFTKQQREDEDKRRYKAFLENRIKHEILKMAFDGRGGFKFTL